VDESDDCFAQNNIKAIINAEKQFSQNKFKLQKKQSKEGKVKTSDFVMKPQQVQIQAALYLGSRRLSTFSYSRPI
jgi:hypothetical protein